MDHGRRCIKCTDHPLMETAQVNELSVDICPSCRGLWLDRDELRRLSAHPDELEALRQRVSAEEPGPEPAASGECPACQRRLGIAMIGSFSVEYCTICGGVFLDRGELNKVLEQTEAKNIATIVALARSMVVSGSVG
jgi:Zn-finger nucleic acid-binding protein